MIGAQVGLGIAKEDVRGTAETTADFYVPTISLTLDDKVEVINDESAYGRIEDSACSGVLNRYGEGELEGKVDLPTMGLLLLATLGESTSTVVEAGEVFNHVFTLAQSVQHPSLTLFLDDKVQDYKYALAMIDSLTIKVEKGNYAMINASFRSKAGVEDTVTSSYTQSFCGFLPKDFTLKLADTVANLGAGTTYGIQSFEINFEKNLEDEQNLGSVTFSDINNKQFSITGNFEMTFDEDAQVIKDYALDQTGRAMEITLQSDSIIGTASNPTLKVTLDEVKFTDPSKPYNNGDIVMMSVSFKAFMSKTNWKMVEAELTNTVTNY